eukprot:TRINITY_DN16968_c0_g1_i1.p1 TRINITY_DN16968_c0_g1~~TRINITY_DN16968_c0_g1_i1.p1  ORF type:complete len:150 (+),score=29.49 TRINITY_DN16968_c0_g1_i1:29-451(+)
MCIRDSAKAGDRIGVTFVEDAEGEWLDAGIFRDSKYYFGSIHVGLIRFVPPFDQKTLERFGVARALPFFATHSYKPPKKGDDKGQIRLLRFKFGDILFRVDRAAKTNTSTPSDWAEGFLANRSRLKIGFFPLNIVKPLPM